MLKLRLLSALGCVLICAASLQAQTVFWSDNFDAPSGGTNNNNAGAGWTLNSGGSGSNNWFINTPSGIGCSSSGNVLHVSCSGGFCGFLGGPTEPIYMAAANNNRSAVSPDISTIGQTNITLTFTFQCQGYTNQDYALLSFSGDGGTTWNELPEKYQDEPGCSTLTIPVPAQYQGISNFRLRFRWIESNAALGTDPPMSVDNIVLSAASATCTPPTVSAGAAVSVCQGQTVSLGGSPTASGGSPSNYVYSWSPATGLSDATVANPTLTASNSGTYTVTVHGGDPSCAASAQVTVTVNPAPTVTLSPAGPITLCQGQTATLNATSGLTSYMWSTPSGMVSGGASFTASDAGSYSVSATQNGCTGNSNSVNLSVNPPFQVNVSPSGNLSICQGESIDLVAANGYTNYVWSNQVTGQTLTVTEAGGYSVSAQNSNGCSGASQIINVSVNPLPVAAFSYLQLDEDDFNVQFTFTGSNANAWLWDFGGSTSTEQNPVHAFLFNDQWPVTLIASNECGSDTLLRQIDVIKTGIAGIPGLELQLQPNPARQTLYLTGFSKQALQGRIRILSITGQQIQEMAFQANAMVQQSIEIGHLAPGHYLLRIETEQGQTTLPFLTSHTW
jgi:hypothetical protein